MANPMGNVRVYTFDSEMHRVDAFNSEMQRVHNDAGSLEFSWEDVDNGPASAPAFVPAFAPGPNTTVHTRSPIRFTDNQGHSLSFRPRTLPLRQQQPAFARYASNQPPATFAPPEPSLYARVDSLGFNIPRTSQHFRSSNEARPTRPQEMESSGGGALAAQAAPLPSHSHTPDPFTRVMGGDSLGNDFSNDQFHFGQQQPTGPLDTPLHVGRMNHFQPSNVRESGQDLQLSPTTTSAANAANRLANNLNNGPLPDSWAHQPPFTGAASADDLENAALSNIFADHHDPYQLQSIPSEWDEVDEDPPLDEPEQDDVEAYAKLGFADGDYYITTTEVVLGRDMDVFKKFREKEELELRAAEDAVEQYRNEPASQPGDADNYGEDPSSMSSHSLEGRPVKGIPSTFSEQGGAVSYVPDEDARPRNGKSKRHMLVQSSSTNSIAPASLHPSAFETNNGLGHYTAQADTEIDQVAQGFVPIHPAVPEDIKHISKQHLLFRYNFGKEAWEVEVLGARALVNDVHYVRGDVVPLAHRDIIGVTSLEVEFKLPEPEKESPGPSRGTFASGDAEDVDGDMEMQTPLNTSPSRRLSNAIAAADTDEEEDVVMQEAKAPRKKKSGIKLNLGKKRKAAKEEDEAEDAEDVEKLPEKPAKKQKRKESVDMSPDAGKKPDKGKKPAKTSEKKPKTADKQPKAPDGVPEVAGTEPAKDVAGIATEDGETKAEKVTPPTQAINLEPGSIFEGVAPEHLPQKRKGPGRPPKNGLISKRDQSFVKRKQKEYEKRGQAPPPFDQLVAEVRAETKQKEAAAKAAARGEPAPEMPVVQSIEGDANTGAAPKPTDDTSYPMMDPNTSATPAEPARKSSPKSKRIVKSPSPMKAEHEYTEEELKKPTITYVHILDEVLKDHPIGKADLQELYDRICKRYPHFKFKTGTSGWQSSVRHNLLQHERFKEDGRSGKGRLWAINYDYPLEKEKKRNRTPPPQRFPQMPNGTYPPGQMGPYGQPNFNGPYGQPPSNGVPPPGGPYYSPYGAGHYGPPTGHHGAPPPGQQPYGAHPPNNQHPHNYPHVPPPQQQRERSSAAPAQFARIVDEIMAYRTHMLSGFLPETEKYVQYDKIFSKCTTLLSDMYHGTRVEDRPDLSEEERAVYDGLEVIFLKHKRNEAAAAAAREASNVQTGGANMPTGTGPSGSAQPIGGAGRSASAGTGVAQAGQVSAPIDVDAPTPGPSAMVRPPVPMQSTPGPARAPIPAQYGAYAPGPAPRQTTTPTAVPQPAGTSGLAVRTSVTTPIVTQPVAAQPTESTERPEPAATNSDAVDDAELRRLLTE